MARGKRLASTAVGFILGAVVINTAPAFADLPVIDVLTIAQETMSVVKETGILDVLNTMSEI